MINWSGADFCSWYDPCGDQTSNVLSFNSEVLPRPPLGACVSGETGPLEHIPLFILFILRGLRVFSDIPCTLSVLVS